MVVLSGVIVGSGSGTTLGEISEFMDVHAVLAVGVKSFNGAGYFSGREYVFLAERDDSSGVGIVGVENANSVPSVADFRRAAGVGEMIWGV